MGVSTRIEGVKPPDGTWTKMKAVYDACIAASLPVPAAVTEFFDGEPPSPFGVKVALCIGYGHTCEYHASVHPQTEDGGSGFLVEIAKLPKDVKFIRFMNSW